MILERSPGGRMPADACFLQACIMEAGDGEYVETGVYGGDSLVFVGLVKRFLGHTGKIYGIEKDASRKKKIESTLALYNINAEVIYKSSFPFPLPDLRPVVAYIDGDHTFEGACADWRSLSPITQRFLVCHDYHINPGPTKMIDEVAKADPAWRYVGCSRFTAVFERSDDTVYVGRAIWTTKTEDG
jgi:hypothetical protein